MKLTQKEIGKFSLARVVAQLATPDGLQTGFEAEVCREAGGEMYDLRRPVIPWSVFQRDMTAASAGAYLVATDTPDAVDVLRPWSVTLQAGVTGMPGLQGNVALCHASPRRASPTG